MYHKMCPAIAATHDVQARKRLTHLEERCIGFLANDGARIKLEHVQLLQMTFFQQIRTRPLQSFAVLTLPSTQTFY